MRTDSFLAAPALGPLPALAGASLIRQVANAAMGTPGLIPLWFGEPDVPTPDFIRQAATDALAAGDTFYTQGLGRPALRQAIADYQSALLGAAIGSERIAVTTSGLNAVNLACQLLLQPGDVLTAITPLWPNLTTIPAMLGAKLRRVALVPENGQWHLDVEALCAALDGARVVLVNSPQNPTGWVAEQPLWQMLLSWSRATGGWIIADEVYARLMPDRQVAPSVLTLAQAEDHVIAINSFSKAWAMTGWRLGWLTVPASVLPVLERMMEFSVSCAPGFHQAAGLAALRHGEAFIAASRARYAAAGARLAERVARLPRLSLPRGQGAFYGFLRVAGVEDDLAFATELAQRAGVGVAPGSAFGPEGRGWLRICHACDPARIDAAFDRLEGYLS